MVVNCHKIFDAHVHGAQLHQELQSNISKALHWLSCQEHPMLCLIQQNEASDWADIMPRSGFVLYSNALWYCVKKLYALDQLDETKKLFKAEISIL